MVPCPLGLTESPMGKGSSTWLRSGVRAAAAAPILGVCVGEEPRSGGSSFSPSDEGPLSWITGLASLLKWMVSCSIQLWPEQHSSATAKHLLCPSGEGNGQTKGNFSLVTKAMHSLGNQGKATLLFFSPVSSFAGEWEHFHFHNSYPKKYQLESNFFFSFKKIPKM